MARDDECSQPRGKEGAMLTDKELKEKVDALDSRIKELVAAGKIDVTVTCKSGLGAISQINLDLLGLKVASCHLMDVFADMVGEATDGNAEIQKRALYFASLEKMSLNEAAGRV